jgi:hypothetical protein
MPGTGRHFPPLGKSMVCWVAKDKLRNPAGPARGRRWLYRPTASWDPPTPNSLCSGISAHGNCNNFVRYPFWGFSAWFPPTLDSVSQIIPKQQHAVHTPRSFLLIIFAENYCKLFTNQVWKGKFVFTRHCHIPLYLTAACSLRLV